ncbi:MAG: methylmalonyl-CoA epimerase [Candidatus Bathyarchaeia archaeon]
MIKKLDHIGIAVKNLQETSRFYEEVLGLKVVGTEVVSDQKVRVAFIPLGDTRIELLEATQPDGPVAKFIEKRGEGIHHIAVAVENIETEIEQLNEKRIRLIDACPRKGAHKLRIAFVHPKSSHGVLLELSEPQKI